MKSDLSIKPLSEESLEDYLTFFESVQFTDNPHWSDCYCYSFHFTGPADQWIREKNKAAVIRLEPSCEALYKGPLDLYKRNGFSVILERENYLVVRKTL